MDARYLMGRINQRIRDCDVLASRSCENDDFRNVDWSEGLATTRQNTAVSAFIQE